MKKNNIQLRLVLLFVGVLIAQIFFAQGIGINASGDNPHPSAILDVSSTTKGFLPPRMTTAQRDAIASPTEGLYIFNTTTGCAQFFVNGIWQDVKCATCPTLASAPTAGTNTPSATQMVWSWNSVSGASGYKWNTTNNYVAATDLGNTTTVTQTGLTCGTSNTIYVWAYNSCGNTSPELTLTQSTSACPFICGTNTVTFTYKGSSVTYGTVVGANNRCWLNRNLGATQVATSSTDANSYGDLFQWGRGDDGHQTRTSSTITTLSNSDQPGHGNFIRVSVSPFDWRSGNNTNRWNAIPIVNNPCPSGWRVPTEVELNAERNSWITSNAAGALASPLKLPMAGYRDDTGALNFVGTRWYYWASKTYGNPSEAIGFDSGFTWPDGFGNVHGLSVRCIKD